MDVALYLARIFGFGFGVLIGKAIFGAIPDVVVVIFLFFSGFQCWWYIVDGTNG